MGRKIIIWFVIFTVLLLIVPFFWGTYNRLIKREENVKMAWSQVENQYQRRADLIMNLVETVKGYASHEQETFRQVIEARAIAKTIYDDGRVPVKAVIKYPDWNYTRNAFGVIIDRYHTAYIIFKMKDGTHRMVDIGFKQLYNGSSYGKTQLRGIGTNNLTVEYP